IPATLCAGLYRRAERRVTRKCHADCFRRSDNHETVLFGKPLRAERVDLLERNRRKEAAMEGQLLPNRRERFVLKEVARVLVGAALRLAVGTLGHTAFV